MTNKEKNIKIKQELTYDIFYDLYITKNMTYNDIQKIYSYVSRDTIKQLNLENYHIEKEIYVVKKLKDKITHDDFYQLYIIENKTYAEIAKIYHVNRHNIEALNVNYFHIEKSDDLQTMARLESNKKKHNGIIYNNREMAKNTCLTKYGVDNVSKVSEIQNKKINTCLEHYGYEYPFDVPEIQKKIRSKYITTICKTHNKNIDEVTLFNDNDKLIDFVKQLHENKQNLTTMDVKKYFPSYQIDQITRRLNDLELINKYVSHTHNTSSYELEIIDFLKSLGVNNIVSNDKNTIGKEIDIYLSDYKFGIEFNGNYWHSDAVKKYQDHNGRSTAHQEKSLLAESKGVFLYHIFEYEWNNEKLKEQIKSNLRNILSKNTIKYYAKKCIIKVVDIKEKKLFLNNNHIQGNVSSQINLGLYYDDELISLMCFKNATQGGYKYELNRFCSKTNSNVVGGASKLFKYFVNNYLHDGEKVVSYNNITKTKGKLYEILKFKYDHISKPNYIWWNPHTNEILSRYQTQITNEEVEMHNKGFYRICDCGTKTWVYIK